MNIDGENKYSWKCSGYVIKCHLPISVRESDGTYGLGGISSGTSTFVRNTTLPAGGIEDEYTISAYPQEYLFDTEEEAVETFKRFISGYDYEVSFNDLYIRTEHIEVEHHFRVVK